MKILTSKVLRNTLLSAGLVFAFSSSSFAEDNFNKFPECTGFYGMDGIHACDLLGGSMGSCIRPKSGPLGGSTGTQFKLLGGNGGCYL